MNFGFSKVFNLCLLKKAIAVLVTNCFLFSFCLGPAIAAAVDAKEAAKEYKQIFEDFILPYSYGKITDSNFANSDRIIVNIQDLHCHPQVQKNIGKIIELFDKEYGVKNVYLEGAYGDIDTSWLLIENNENKRKKQLEAMMATGLLTGAEYYSAASGRVDLIKGLEVKEPYLENLKTFGWLSQEKESIDIIISEIEESMTSLKKKYYNKRQFKLERLYKNYSSGKISARKYFAILSKHTDKLGVDLYKYPNTLLYIEMLKNERQIDYKAVSRQLHGLVSILKEQLPYSAYKMLLDSTANFSEVEKLYGYLISISRKFQIDLEVNFPQLNEYFKYVEMSQKINPLELVSEEQRLSDEINSRFSNTKTQREIVFLAGFNRCIKDFLNGKIMASDYEYYVNNMPMYRKLYVKYVDNRVLSLLDEYLERVGRFYEINIDRNEYFVRQLGVRNEELGINGKNTPAASEPQSQPDANAFLNISNSQSPSSVINSMKGKRVDIMVTGGFHTSGISQMLKAGGISYIVITPNVENGVKEAEELYYKVAREQSKIAFQTLATMIASLAKAEQIKLWAAADWDTEVKLYGRAVVDNISAQSEGENSKEALEILKLATKAAGILDSDENKKEIIDALVEKIKANLTEEYSQYVNSELVAGLNLDAVKEAFDKDISALENIIRNALNQNLNFLENLFEELKLFSALVNQAQQEGSKINKPAFDPRTGKINFQQAFRSHTISILTSPAAASDIAHTIIASSENPDALKRVDKKSPSKPQKSGFVRRLTQSVLLAVFLSFSALFFDVGASASIKAQTVLAGDHQSPYYLARHLHGRGNDFFTNEAVTPDNMKKSIEFSNSPKMQKIVNKIYDMLEEGKVIDGVEYKIEFIRRYPILFLFGTTEDGTTGGCAYNDLGLIVLPADDIQKMSERKMIIYLCDAIAHEAKHRNNYEAYLLERFAAVRNTVDSLAMAANSPIAVCNAADKVILENYMLFAYNSSDSLKKLSIFSDDEKGVKLLDWLFLVRETLYSTTRTTSKTTLRDMVYNLMKESNSRDANGDLLSIDDASIWQSIVEEYGGIVLNIPIMPSELPNIADEFSACKASIIADKISGARSAQNESFARMFDIVEQNYDILARFVGEEEGRNPESVFLGYKTRSSEINWNGNFGRLELYNYGSNVRKSYLLDIDFASGKIERINVLDENILEILAKNKHFIIRKVNARELNWNRSSASDLSYNVIENDGNKAIVKVYDRANSNKPYRYIEIDLAAGKIKKIFVSKTKQAENLKQQAIAFEQKQASKDTVDILSGAALTSDSTRAAFEKSVLGNFLMKIGVGGWIVKVFIAPVVERIKIAEIAEEAREKKIKGSETDVGKKFLEGHKETVFTGDIKHKKRLNYVIDAANRAYAAVELLDLTKRKAIANLAAIIVNVIVHLWLNLRSSQEVQVQVEDIASDVSEKTEDTEKMLNFYYSSVDRWIDGTDKDSRQFHKTGLYTLLSVYADYRKEKGVLSIEQMKVLFESLKEKYEKLGLTILIKDANTETTYKDFNEEIEEKIRGGLYVDILVFESKNTANIEKLRAINKMAWPAHLYLEVFKWLELSGQTSANFQLPIKEKLTEHKISQEEFRNLLANIKDVLEAEFPQLNIEVGDKIEVSKFNSQYKAVSVAVAYKGNAAALNENAVSSSKKSPEVIPPQAAAESAAKAANPAQGANVAQKIAVKLVSQEQAQALINREVEMSNNLIGVTDSYIAARLQAQGIKNAVILSSENRFEPKNGWRKIGVVSGNVKVYAMVDANGIMHIGFNTSEQNLEASAQALSDFISEGLQDEAFKGVKRFVVTNETNVSDIVNAVKNAYTDSVNTPVKERLLNLQKMERNISNFNGFCINEFRANDVQIFTVSEDQWKHFRTEIESLQQKGIRFIVETKDYGEIKLDGIRVDAKDKKSIDEVKIILSRLKNLKAETFATGFDARITIELSDEILKSIDVDIWKNYGVMPVISNSKLSKIGYQGKFEAEFAENAGRLEIETTLRNDNAAALSVSNSQTFALNLSDGTILKEKLREAKTAKQQYDKGLQAALDSKFDYTALNVSSLFSLIGGDRTEQNKETLKADIEKAASIAELSEDSVSYINYLLQNNRCYEALGFIRGIVMNSAREEYKNILKEKGIELDLDKFKNIQNGKYQKAILTLLVQLKMNGRIKNADDLKNLMEEEVKGERSYNTAKEFLDALGAVISGNLDDILRSSEYEITPVNDNDTVVAEMFKQFDILVKERLRKAGTNKQVQTSMRAVKNVLSAA